MASLYIKLLGTPLILNEHGETLSLPYRKAEALLYYLTIHKQATRNELVHLLWGDIEEQAAKKNLRNAMYKIRKALALDVIISPQKNYVMLNPDIIINTDIEVLLKESVEYEELIELLAGDFLKGFIVKDANSFEDWIMNQRDYYQDVLISRLEQSLQVLSGEQRFKEAEQLAKLWVKMDSFDERAYRRLMNIYKLTFNYNKGIEVFNRLQELLNRELGIAPDTKTKLLFEEIMELKRFTEIKTNEQKDFFFGRKEELDRILDNYLSFLQGKSYRSTLLIGEAGIGKTKIKQRFLNRIKETEITVIETECYQAEEGYFLKPWNQIFSKLATIIKDGDYNLPNNWQEIISHLFPNIADELGTWQVEHFQGQNPFQYQRLEEVILGVIKEISKKQKLVFIFEDIHWIDTTSLALVKSLLLHQRNVFFIGTSRFGYGEKLDPLTTLLLKYNLIEEIVVERFTPKEIELFINQALPERKNGQNLIENVIKQTEGNPFFLVELINLIKEKGSMDILTSNMQGILKSRLMDVSEEGKKLLNIASVFFDEVTLDMLVTLSGKTELELLDILDELQHRYLLLEKVVNDRISFQFSHQKLREFIYQQQSNTRRRVLHFKIGLMLEQYLTNEKTDTLLYSKLIYHFIQGGEKKRALKYKILHAKQYFDYNHELFPVLDNPENEVGHLYITKEHAYQLLQETQELLIDVKSSSPSHENAIYEMMFLHMKGRLLIREGDYKDGIVVIKEMIRRAEEQGKEEYILKGYKQMIFYAIQTHQIDVMETYVEKGMILVKEWSEKAELGILLRLKGLLLILTGQYKKAESMLLDSIEIFKTSPKKYALNIAASYQYLGDIRRNNQEFASALVFYEKAKEIAVANEVLKGIALFNTKSGQAAYQMGDFLKAKEYFLVAIDAYNRLGYHWGRAIAEGHLALIAFNNKELKDGAERLYQAEHFAEIYQSPYELGFVNMVKAMVKHF